MTGSGTSVAMLQLTRQDHGTTFLGWPGPALRDWTEVGAQAEQAAESRNFSMQPGCTKEEAGANRKDGKAPKHCSFCAEHGPACSKAKDTRTVL